MKLHKKLKYLRTTKNLTQKSVAAKIGLNVRQYQRYENGEQTPTATVLSRLCHFFKVPSGYFLEISLSSEENKKNKDLSTPLSYLELLEETYIMEQQMFKAIGIDEISELHGELIEKIRDKKTKLQELEAIIKNLNAFQTQLKFQQKKLENTLALSEEKKYN